MILLLSIGDYVASHMIGILGALVAMYVVGFTWHGPLFGKQWMKANNMTPPKPGDMKFSMMMPGLTASFFHGLAMSSVLGWLFMVLGTETIGEALLTTGVFSVAFTGLAVLNSNAWLGKKMEVTWLDGGYYLVSTLVMGAVLFWTL